MNDAFLAEAVANIAHLWAPKREKKKKKKINWANLTVPWSLLSSSSF